jgi:hypothetical protein
MGLDAFVSCRCWQDGLTTPPPVPRELVVCDEETRLDLTIPYDGNEDLYRDLDNWVHSGACGHEQMDQASVHVSNWTGYRLFQEALKTAGWQHFPTLQAYLPQDNGGSLPAREAPRALAELQRFTSQTRLGTYTYLADEETGERLGEYVPAYRGVFCWDPHDKNVGVDPAGLFVVDTRARPPREVFRSPRCSQEVIGVTRTWRSKLLRLPGARTGRSVTVRLTDASTARSVTVRLSDPITRPDADPDPARYPRHLRVAAEPFTAGDFAAIVQALEEVLHAAIETGNPVIWC